jgi:ArsR family metal-binding transcriptional regulator
VAQNFAKLCAPLEVIDVGVDVIEIYRLLPKIDCGQCSSGSCTAFAKDVLEDCSRLSECTRLSPYGLMMIKTLLCQGK